MSPFDEVIDRRGTDALKWARYAGRDVLPSVDWDHGLASARAPDHDMRATLAKLHAICALH